MRERVREKERERGTQGGSGSESVGKGLVSRGVNVSGFGISLDRCCRSSQIGNSRITLEASDGRFGSVCRLEALKGAASHFVFLDRSSVLWLEESLQVASSIGWKFPASCNWTSNRRTVSVTSFISDGEQVLKISESCSNGIFFFVLVPSASNGWKRLLLLCQEWIASALAPPPPVPHPSSRPPASFASIVIGPSLSSIGRCSESDILGCPGISVEKDGIQDRLEYLECCVVFRFCSQDVIDWPRFRRWANKNWGTALNAPIHKLDDELWLLFCDSKAKVERIFSLNRNTFGDTPILLDKWIPEAGRSRVTAGDHVVWITVRGIPIHLRSSDLFRQIGSVCGVFLGFEVCNSLSSVRIKIRRAGSIPEVVPIYFEGVSFKLSVLTDRGDYPWKEESQPLCSSGKAVLSPLPPSRFDSTSRIEIGASSVSDPPSPVSFSDTVSSDSPTFSRTPPASTNGTSSDDTTGAISETPLIAQRTENVLVVSELSTLGPRECSRFEGLNLSCGDFHWLLSLYSGRQSTPLVKLLSGLNHLSMGLKVSMAPLTGNWAVWASDVPKARLTLTSTDFSKALVDDSISAVSAFPIGAELSSHEEGFGNFVSAPPVQSSCSLLPSTPPPSRSVSVDLDPLLSEVKKAAAIFGLELEGSKRLGSEAALDSCSDISARLSRSRRDREWHRLGFSPDSPLVSGPRSSRRDSCPAPATRHVF
ncbi:hypothetical protein LINPERHAP2_LOCUS5118 [Linum perenne]